MVPSGDVRHWMPFVFMRGSNTRWRDKVQALYQASIRNNLVYDEEILPSRVWDECNFKHDDRSDIGRLGFVRRRVLKMEDILGTYVCAKVSLNGVRSNELGDADGNKAVNNKLVWRLVRREGIFRIDVIYPHVVTKLVGRRIEEFSIL